VRRLSRATRCACTQHRSPSRRWLGVSEQCKFPRGATIFNPYMRSVSLGIAALRGRYRYIGCDTERRWFDISRARIEQEVAQEQLFKPEVRIQEQVHLFGEVA